MKARTIGIVAAAGLAALISGCKEEKPGCKSLEGAQPQQTQPSVPQEPKYTEEITAECIHVYKEQVPWLYDTENSNYDWVRIDWCRGANATMLTFFGQEHRTGMVADTMLGDIIWSYHDTINGNYFRINDNPESIRIMNLFGKYTWDHVCGQLDCKGLLEKQERMRNEQLPIQSQQVVPEQPQERIWTEVLDNVYFLNNKPGSELPDAIFTDGSDIVDLDSLWVKVPNEVYADYGRDGIVDEVASSITGVRYYRNAETADMFNRADAALAQAKEEIGLEE